MSLINCPECGKEVFYNAATCPNCGYAIKKNRIINNARRTVDDVVSGIRSKLTKKVLICMGSVIFAIILIFVAMAIYKSTLPDDQTQSVIDLIENTNLLECATPVKYSEVISKYNALSDKQKAKVSNADKIEEIGNKIVKSAEQKIDAIKEPVLGKTGDMEDAYEYYTSLPSDLKKSVSNYSKIQEAVDKYNSLEIKLDSENNEGIIDVNVDGSCIENNVCFFWNVYGYFSLEKGYVSDGIRGTLTVYNDVEKVKMDFTIPKGELTAKAKTGTEVIIGHPDGMNVYSYEWDVSGAVHPNFKLDRK